MVLLIIKDPEGNEIALNPARIELVRVARDNSGNTAIFLAGDDNPLMTKTDMEEVIDAWARTLDLSYGDGASCVEAF